MFVVVVTGIISLTSADDVECPDPGVPDGGTRQGPARFTPGSKVSFDCPEGYERVGSPVAVCKDSGEWSLPVPQCIPDCAEIEAPANGVMSVSSGDLTRKYGSVARFACNSGYSLVGASAITCSNGEWNRPVPSCFADCVAVESPSRAITVGGSSHGDVMYFKCLPGFHLIGQGMITCKDGSWSDESPSCVPDV